MNRKILLVEDEELLSSAFSLILQKEGYKVKIAQNGKIALKLIPSFKPDLIYLDLLMPEMGGVEFLKQYKSADNDCPPIIVLSNLHDQEVVDQVKSLGVTEFIVKSQITPGKMTSITKSMLAI